MTLVPPAISAGVNGAVGKPNAATAAHHATAVLLGRTDQDVRIARQARGTMKRQRVCADDDELNGVRAQ